MRVQLFNSEGGYLTEWADLRRPSDVYLDRQKDLVYLGEMGGPSLASRISIRDLQGKVLSSWEGYKNDEAGVLRFPHGIGVDSRGNIYEGVLGSDPGIRKFAKIR
jgi:hypothetical protein